MGDAASAMEIRPPLPPAGEWRHLWRHRVAPNYCCTPPPTCTALNSARGLRRRRGRRRGVASRGGRRPPRGAPPPSAPAADTQPSPVSSLSRRRPPLPDLLVTPWRGREEEEEKEAEHLQAKQNTISTDIREKGANRRCLKKTGRQVQEKLTGRSICLCP
nr:uncharacterized protein LOC4341503 isoform X1 [Oryza sativa Japonica Group]